MSRCVICCEPDLPMGENRWVAERYAAAWEVIHLMNMAMFS